MNPYALKHNNKELQILRLLSMFGLGYYLFRTMQVEGSVGKALNDPNAARFKTKEFLGMAGKVLKNNIPPEAAQIFEKEEVKEHLEEIGTSIVDSLIGQKRR